MADAAVTAYLFQCEGEDLYAVSHEYHGQQHPPLSLHAGLAPVRGIPAGAPPAGAGADLARPHPQGHRGCGILCLARLEQRTVRASGAVVEQLASASIMRVNS
jgi:hypothetical protein